MNFAYSEYIKGWMILIDSDHYLIREDLSKEENKYSILKWDALAYEFKKVTTRKYWYEIIEYFS